MKASGLNRMYYVEKLIELGAKADLKDKNGRTALDYANLYDWHDIVERLL